MRNINLARLLSALTFVFALTLLSQSVAFGQCATNGSPNIENAGWQKGTTVKYFIDPSITDANARDAITQAFENWNNASSANNSGVTYELTTTRPASTDNYLIVNYGSNLTDPQTGAQLRAQASYSSDTNTGYTTRGAIRMDPSMTNYDAVLEAMVHEIGHPMGLGHCTGSGCTAAGSVMTLVVPDPPTPENFNRSYGRSTTPTACDNQTLQQSNYPPCSPPIDGSCNTWDANQCTCLNYNNGGGGGGGGDGGGGGGYYCTPYYWVYYESWDGGETWYMTDMEYAGCW